MKLHGVLLRAVIAVGIITTSTQLNAVSRQETTVLPNGPLAFGAFTCEFSPDGTFQIKGEGWPPFVGSWKVSTSELTLTFTEGEEDCSGPGRYGFEVKEGHLHLELVADDCVPRRMILDGSSWRPEGEAEPVVERRIVLTTPETRGPLPDSGPAVGSWPSFRGPAASGVADGQKLPYEWN